MYTPAHLNLSDGDDEHLLADVAFPADVIVRQEDHRLQLEDQRLQQAGIATVEQLHIPALKRQCDRIG
jgi:hypothetical protein